MPRDEPIPAPMADRKSNLRTALILLSVAAVFFAGVIVNRLLFAP